MTVSVTDWDGNPLTVGSQVIFGDDPIQRGVVTEITDPDGDVDDEGRTVNIPPYVTVTFPDGGTERVRSYLNAEMTWGFYPDGPDVWTFACDDLELLFSGKA